MVSRHAFPAMGPTQFSPWNRDTYHTHYNPGPRYMWTVHPTALEASVSVKGMCACGRNAETDSLMEGLTDKEGLPTNSTHYLGLCPPYGGRHQSPPHTHTLLIIP